MNNNIRRIFIIFVLLAVVSAGCTSDEKQQASPAPKTLQKVSLQLQWVTQAQFAGYYVALEKGWYREQGIDLTIKPGSPDLLHVNLVEAGASDFGTCLLTDLTVAIQKGKNVISIAQIQQTNGLLLIAMKNSGIKGPKDFIGKNVGVWLGGWEAQFYALLAKEGIAPRSVHVKSQGWSMEPFIKGDLDVASAMIYNEYHAVLEAGVKPENLVIIDYGDYGLDFPGDVLFTSVRVLEKDPDLCVSMLRASLRGWQFAIDHPEEAADVVLKYDQSGVQTKPHQLAMMKEITKLVRKQDRRLGYADQATLQRMIALLQRYGILSGPLQYQDVFAKELFEKI